jgi:hypothetical protein
MNYLFVDLRGLFGRIAATARPKMPCGEKTFFKIKDLKNKQAYV